MSESTPASTNTEAQSQRQRDLALDAEASRLDTHTDIGLRETLRHMRRAMGLIWLFPGAFSARAFLLFGSLAIPITILPWPLKIVIDHVVLGAPIENATGYPFYLRPFVEALHGSTVPEILFALVGLALVMVLLFGAFQQGGATSDQTDAFLDQGHDTATQSENQANWSFSYAGGLWGYLDFIITMRLTQRVNHLLRARLFERMQSFSMTTLEEQRIGDAVYRVMYDTPSFTYVFYDVIFRTGMSIVTFIMAAFALLSAYPTSPEVALIAILIVPTYFLISVPFSRTFRRRGQASRAAGTVVTSTIEEGMDNVLAVQSLGGNEREKEKFAIESNASFKNYRRIVWANLYYGNLTEFAYQFLRVAAIVFVATKVVEGELSIGDYGVVFFYFAFLAGPAYFISRVWIDMQQHITGVRRVFAMMDLPVEQDQGDRELPRIEGGISIRGAGFVYPDGRRALQNVSLDANVGQIVALVGPTGAGKTSLAYLVPRFHTATEGQVQIDGVDVKDVTMESLRSQVTYVFQETQLLADSIVDNIRFGNPDATTDQVESVARTAGIHDFIVSLPDGYQTKLGTTSSKISVGQKQRIAIARGLLRDSRILILDEPTSALDPETEEYLVQALHEAAKNRLVMIIAHRLSTIAQADHIVFLEDGEVREQGSPQELMANPDGAYRRFVELQTTSEE